MSKHEGYRASPGAWEFLEEKHKMLSDFDSAREQIEKRPVKTEHGVVGAAVLRGWLERFLPGRYEVCQGYIIGSWANSLDAPPLRHNDVIIYDALNAPILWVEDNSDVVPDRRSRAIPARHVMAVLEVKARLNSTHSGNACEKLLELNAYRNSLPQSFCCGVVFFEVDPAAETSIAALDNLMPTEPIVGFFGGVVLRGNTIPADLTGELTLIASPTPSSNHVSKEVPLSNARSQWNGSTSVEWPNPEPQAQRATTASATGMIRLEDGDRAHHYLNLVWSNNGFASFAFNLVGRLEGSMSGRGWSRDAPMITQAPLTPGKAP